MTLAPDRHGPLLVYNSRRVRVQGLSQRPVMAVMGKSGLMVVRLAVKWGQFWRRTDAHTTCGHDRLRNSCSCSGPVGYRADLFVKDWSGFSVVREVANERVAPLLVKKGLAHVGD